MIILSLLNFPVAETPLYLLAVPVGPTSIHVTWGTVDPLLMTTGYRISYEGPTSGSVDVYDSAKRDYVLTGLRNNGTYYVSIFGKSNLLPSDRQYAKPVHLGQL